MGCRWLVCAACAYLWLAPAIAAEPPAQIVVRALRDVDEVPYRNIFKGMTVFVENHALAPQARMRFRLYPRAKDASFAALTLTLVAGSAETAIALDDDHVFDLPNDRSLADAGAMIMTNQPEATYAWRVDIRTPGLPPNTRRLGDLRLECKVDMEGAHLRRIVRNPATMAFGDPCMRRTFTNPFFADRPVFNVTLVSGARREAIASESMYANATRLMPEAVIALADWQYARDRQYIPAIADASWPDDTLLVFDYMDDPDRTGAQP